MPIRAMILLALFHYLAVSATDASAETARSLEELKAALSTAAFEPDEKIMRLDLEAARIVEFVSQDVGYVSYSGSLKGINGTLQSLRGNALDQSLLLAHLLKQAGFDARIARSTLSEPDRRRLVLQMSRLDPRPYDIDESVLEESATHERFHRALSQLAMARELLPEPESQLSQLMDEAKDYFWVQYDEGGGWQDSHPAFGQLELPEVRPAEYFAEAIPSSLLQTVSFQVFAQRREAGVVKVLPITDPWQRPSGNLVGDVVTFALVPLGLNEETASDLDGHLAQTDFFAPLLNGSPAGAWVIDNKGNRIDRLAASSAGAGIFKTLGDKTEEAIVGVDPDLEGSFALERIWFEIVLSAPGMPDRTLIRTVYDSEFDGPAGSSTAAAPNAPLFVGYHFAFDVGALAPDYLVHRLIDALSVSNEWLQAMLARGVERHSDTPFPEDEMTRAFGLFSQQTLQNAHNESGVLRYRSEPGILGLRESYRGEGHFRISTDIVNNRQRFLRHAESDLVSDPDAALHHGVWETATEWLPGRLGVSQDSVTLNTIDYLERLISKGDGLRLLNEPESTLPDAALHDLRDGYVLILPKETAAAESLAYWRIYPRSGETLGMLSDGRGSELTEYLAQLVGISMTFVNALSSLAECEANGGNLAERACCIMNAHANTAFDMSYGNVVGALFGESAALVDDIARAQAQNALGVQSVNLMDCGNMQNYGSF
jgi:transglutaminase-like putative cysteine protease